jgi:hypothetical protein
MGARGWSTRKSPGWRKLVRDALSSSDIDKLPEKIALAEAIVCRTIKQIEAKPETNEERQALDDALRSLSILKKRHFPGWNKHGLAR